MRTWTALALCVLAAGAFSSFAAEEPAGALAAQSEAYCASTVNQERPTPPGVVIAKVKEACALLEREGAKAFPQFSGTNSPFLYEGTYVWVHRLSDSEMLMHPIKYEMIGTKVAAMKDAKGKRLFGAMNVLVREKGEGWVEYFWPKPGTQESVHKVSFVRKCLLPDGTEVVVGSGLYNFSEADIAKLELR